MCPEGADPFSEIRSGHCAEERSDVMHAVTSDAYVDMMIRSYGPYYDIHLTEGETNPLREREENLPAMLPRVEDLPLAARCDFHVQNDTSVLLRTNVLYSTQNHEYRYLFKTEHLTLEDYRRFERFVYEDGMGRITPGNGHMSTNLTLAIICGSADDAAVKAAKHCRLHRDFRLGLDGWMDFHTNLVVLETGKIFTNMGGHGDRKHLSAILKVLKKRAAAA